MRGVLVFLLIVGICFTGLAAADSQIADYQKGFDDGRREGRNDVSWVHVAWGFLTVGIHTLVILLVPGKEMPYVTTLLLEGETQSYKRGFIDGYEDGYYNQRLRYSASGAGVCLVLGLIGQATQEGS